MTKSLAKGYCLLNVLWCAQVGGLRLKEPGIKPQFRRPLKSACCLLQTSSVPGGDQVPGLLTVQHCAILNIPKIIPDSIDYTTHGKLYGAYFAFFK